MSFLKITIDKMKTLSTVLIIISLVVLITGCVTRESTPVTTPLSTSVPTYRLTITATAGGTTYPAPGKLDYPKSTVVDVIAQPNTGYRFLRWLLDGSPTSDGSTISVIMNADMTVRAEFEQVMVDGLITNISVYPTYECAGITASYDQDPGQVTTQYRRVGDTSWINVTSPLHDDDSFPLYDDIGRGELRGSLFWLTPNTNYELCLTDSLGSKTVTFQTRNDNPSSTVRTVNVSSNSQLSSAIENAQAGDNIILGSGDYSGFTIEASGQANNYIWIRGTNGVQFNDSIMVRGNYVRISDFSLTSSNTGVLLSYCSNVILSNLRIINTGSSSDSCIRIEYDTQDCLIEKCHLTVNQFNNNDKNGVYWWTGDGGTYPIGGHVFRDNVIDGQPWDGIGGGSEDYATTMNNSDFYNNTVIGASDDGIQPEGGCVNVRVWGNKVYSTRTAGIFGMGYCPVQRGPLYSFRNLVVNTEYNEPTGGGGIYKLGDNGHGRIWSLNNTYYAPTASHNGYNETNNGWSGMRAFNDIIYCGRYIIEAGRPPISDNYWDYCLFHTLDPERYIKYDPIGGWGSLAEMQNSGYMINGIDADPRLSIDDYTLLSDSPCINAAIIIKQINDSLSPWPFSSLAPDMGATEK